ncbi:Uncharacterized protein OS=Singulisphaera acidiphila (strain ATCC BAA-1392 / DSM 18658 / VKM B-2454 / MOB10) GN=Sinac_0682 PE=4 SV=1: Esterase [Gemmata massiliana]|uniref:Peptidase S9 prolyl oligopeptidase catalytic domain-containing protein n=1 Tax=Gemmata massiliana TaxID=1210884 RepID=A0A6P2D697_9BACT|nr:alpha/beta hydrolase-fold protein [Gemmata massiliana]VTR96523.1 Uncharacterized protein OS=Singulisphaera acidiphila (strain ATCC BAA-1392 / DSM 18658 / VKM B-2454 / MOB10) GN=Sinac_0682 PE=4 SV=1: Esterase [Gemmata massiliana]
MRLVLAIGLFASIAVTVEMSQPDTVAAQEKKGDKKVAQPNFDPPKATKPDEVALKQITEKTEQLRKAIVALKEKKIPLHVLIEVEIYLKAAENIVRFEEWYHANSGKWALTTLDQGLARAKQAEDGKAVWRDAPGKWVLRAYLAENVDESIQPYAVLLPPDYGKDPQKKWRVDIVLHGRDASLTEAKFIATHGGASPKDLDRVIVEVYGRGNNAYRWAGESDVMSAVRAFFRFEEKLGNSPLDPSRVVLRGFSMGGAGAWHMGLHHPFMFAAIGPGAGFTTTRGYIANLPKQLPDYQEKCLHIYDAVDYAENAFNVPIVAYSGEKDPQKKAADNIESALKAFKEPLKFTHLVAPGLEHQMPKEWQDKAEAEFKKYLSTDRKSPDRVRFVTYTTRYHDFGHGDIEALDRHYERAVIDSRWTKDGLRIETTNVAAIRLLREEYPFPAEIAIDGQKVPTKGVQPKAVSLFLTKTGGQWSITDRDKWQDDLRKRKELQGPIDDAFLSRFVVVKPGATGFAPGMDKHATASVNQFVSIWDRYFRGALPVCDAEGVGGRAPDNLVLFGDPQSNPLIAKVLPKLPITWTEEKLGVNGVEYDPKTHVPVLIYPNPQEPTRYVVINSGHTFKEADLKGTNALLYPRLGDWAVIKPAPTEKDPAAYEVVAAGLFDENWQFPKK